MLLPSKTSKKGVAFVNISNIRRSFEKYAKKVLVVIEPLLSSADMEKKTVVTRSGRRATAILDVANKPKLLCINNENTGTKRDIFVTNRRRIKKTMGMETTSQKTDLKVNKKCNLRISTATAQYPKDHAVRKGRPPYESKDKTDQTNLTNAEQATIRLRLRSSIKITDSLDTTKNIIDCSVNKQIDDINNSITKPGRPKKNLLQIELNESTARRCSPRNFARNGESNKVMDAEISNNKKVGKRNENKVKNTSTKEAINICINKSSTEDIGRNKAEIASNSSIKENEKAVLNKTKVNTRIARQGNKSGRPVEKMSVSKRSTGKITGINKEIGDTPVKSGNIKRKKIIEDFPINLETIVGSKKAVKFDEATKRSLSSDRQLRKRNVITGDESTQKRENVSNKEAKRIPIYKRGINDSDSEDYLKNKKDIYKFTVDCLEKSDYANIYDKDTDKIMCLIRKVERVKAKRKLKPKESNRRKPKIQKQAFVEVELLSGNKLRTYPSKTANRNIVEAQNISRNIAEEQNNAPILADVVVHAPLSGNKSLSAFDKLKSTQSPSRKAMAQNISDCGDDFIEVYQAESADVSHFDTPGSPTSSCLKDTKSTLTENAYAVSVGNLDTPTPSAVSVYSKNTVSPFLHNAKNIPEGLFVTTRKPVYYTSQFIPNYDCSNNFGFDENEEQSSPEKSILVHLNEVSRKLQKRTPWRNRLIVKNKRVLAVKNSSLPSVEQELILDSTIVDKLIGCSKRKKNDEEVRKEHVQTKLSSYFDHVETADVSTSTLFDVSPVKQIEPTKAALIRSNVIVTPRHSFRRTILQSKNQQSTPNIIEAENEGTDSYFGFISPVANKNVSKENVLAEKSPSKLPLRLDPGDLRRFSKKYVSKKQRTEEEKKLEAKGNNGVMTANEAPISDDDGDELPMLGLFDELLQTEPEEDRARTRKRGRTYDCDTTERISRTKKRRDKKAVSEFNKWAEKFNKMCREVEKHELLVE